MSYALQHLKEASEIIDKMDVAAIEKMADLLATVKAEGGRIFFLGVGGSAGRGDRQPRAAAADGRVRERLRLRRAGPRRPG
jgi:phosphoheptose isomerase